MKRLAPNIKNCLTFCAAIGLLTASFISCQKELHFPAEDLSRGFLLKDNSGNCLPVRIDGVFVQGKKLTDTNAIQVSVQVKKAGSYLIKTDDVNGYRFEGSGNFNSAGIFTVGLKAIGTPLTAGNNTFTIQYDTSKCKASVVVNSNTVQPAIFSLQGAPDFCSGATVEGTFVKNITIDTASKAIIKVQVNTAGPYTITTNTVNGYSFSATGVFTTTGLQTIQLHATGKPLNIGTDVFTISAGSSSCKFNVIVLQPLVITNNDYFPLTLNSFWHYKDPRFPDDSLKRRIKDSVIMTGTSYKVMEEADLFNTSLSYFRKFETNYYEYARVDKYTVSFQYGTPVMGDIPFLKENISPVSTWDSPEYTGTATFGQVIHLQYRFFCLDTGATVTVNGIAFSNVFKILMMPFIKAPPNNWGSTNETYEYYYAKGIGLIYTKKFLNGLRQYELMLKRFQVN